MILLGLLGLLAHRDPPVPPVRLALQALVVPLFVLQHLPAISAPAPPHVTTMRVF